MALDVLVNYAEATTSGGGTTAATTDTAITVASISGTFPALPAGTQVRVMDRAQLGTIEGEVMALTADAGGLTGTWTVTRAVEGTLATHAAGWVMVPVTTAGGFDGRYASLTQIITTSQTVIAPVWATIATVVATGAGGGGGGAGTALTTGGVTNQAYGGGGGAGEVIEATVATSGGQSWSITVGAGGSGGAGGAVNGNTGAAGTAGGNTTFGSALTAFGGGGGGASPANSSSEGTGGAYAAGPASMSTYPPSGTMYPLGFGGTQQSPITPFGSTIGGGGGFFTATATVGGPGGSAVQSAPVPNYLSGPGTATPTTANGTNGQSSPVVGCGGGGGGAGAPGGTGGAGGNGGPGLVTIEWRTS